MKIGIKYCGGCNPRFDRRKFADDLIKYYNEISFAAAKENESYDIVLVICGCNSACANHEMLRGKQKIVIKSELEFSKTIKIIDEFYYNLRREQQ